MARKIFTLIESQGAAAVAPGAPSFGPCCEGWGTDGLRSSAVRLPPFTNPVAPGSGRSTRAFTLIELIVVLTVVAIAAGVVIPRMGRSVGATQLRESAARFAQTARTVRELAQVNAREFAIEIDLSAGAYGVLMRSEGQMQSVQGSWLKPARFPTGVRADHFRQPDGTRAASGTQRLSFHPDGTSTGGSLQLTDGTDAVRIVVHPHSGRIVWGDPKRTVFLPDQIDLGD